MRVQGMQNDGLAKSFAKECSTLWIAVAYSSYICSACPCWILEEIADAIVIFQWLVCANINFGDIVRHPFVITQTARTALKEFWTSLACTMRKICQRCERIYPSLNTPKLFLTSPHPVVKKRMSSRPPRCVHSMLGWAKHRYCSGARYWMLLHVCL